MEQWLPKVGKEKENRRGGDKVLSCYRTCLDSEVTSNVLQHGRADIIVSN